MKRLKYVWHEDVHKRFREELLFFQLTFLPVYKRHDIFDRLKNFVRERSVRSYSIYEVYGYYDLILRLWLPPEQQPSIDFGRDLQDRLEDLGCIRAIRFAVSETVLHSKWWNSEANKTVHPSKRDVENLSAETIRAVDSGRAAQPTITELENQWLLRARDSQRGIRFLVVVSTPALGESPSRLLTGQVQNDLVSTIVSTDTLSEFELYRGEGFAWFLVNGRVLLRGYPNLCDVVLEINKSGVGGFEIRTYTYLVTSLRPRYFVETEAVAALPSFVAEKHDIVYYLQREEDEGFEVKASVLLDVYRYFKDKSGSVILDKKIAMDGVLKAIIGFLNARGGKILIGALETRKFKGLLKDPDNPLHKLPRVGNHLVFGINVEYNSKGPEVFYRRMTDLIRTHIGKDVATAIHIDKLHYRGRDMCVVNVPPGATWYYLDRTIFYVRQPNSTVPLQGRDMDRYKELHPRSVS